MVLTDSDRISHVPPYSGYWYLKTHFIYRAITYIAKLSNLFYYMSLRMFQSYNPNVAETTLVWASSTSLAATTEITIVFFSCAYLDVSVQRVCPTQAWWYVFNIPGFPIQKSTNQKVFAPPRSLSQLITSFFASESLGIPRVPLITY